MAKRRIRTMVADGTTYGWCFGHRHDRVRGYAGCASTLTIWHADTRAQLRLVFGPDGDLHISDSYFDEASVFRVSDRASLNLHEPGAVRALLDESLARGLFPTTPQAQIETDGWPVFDAVVPQPAVSGATGTGSGPCGGPC